MAERAEVEVQVAALQPEGRDDLVHPDVVLQESHAESFGLLIGERAPHGPPDRLPLEELAKEFHHGEDELGEAPVQPGTLAARTAGRLAVRRRVTGSRRGRGQRGRHARRWAVLGSEPAWRREGAAHHGAWR